MKNIKKVKSINGKSNRNDTDTKINSLPQKQNNQTDNKTVKKIKKRKSKYNNNLYLYTQIVITLVFVTVAVMLKTKGGNEFYALKEDYSEFFTTETVYESNFSYKSFFNNLSADIKEKYEILTDTIAYIYGKGKNDTYPDNVSLKKYIPENKGIKPFEGIITSNFGIRKDPFDKKSKDFHTGMDIAAAKGTFIKSSFSGIVTETGYTDVAGNYIKIKTDDKLQTFYGHTQFVFVKEGDNILQGQVIATVGDTGLVTGPHLHFEVIYDGNRVNPVYTIE